jgi:hypothetical protein
MKLTSLGTKQRFALVLSGGVIEGQRPRTALFRLHGVRPDGDYQGQRFGAKSRRRIKRDDVIAIWRGMPHPSQIADARKKLPIVLDVPGNAYATEVARAAITGKDVVTFC